MTTLPPPTFMLATCPHCGGQSTAVNVVAKHAKTCTAQFLPKSKPKVA